MCLNGQIQEELVAAGALAPLIELAKQTLFDVMQVCLILSFVSDSLFHV
jgi:hypothetical protein